MKKESPKEVEKVEDGGTECSRDDQCGEGYKCVNGRCVKGGTNPPGTPPPIPPLAD